MTDTYSSGHSFGHPADREEHGMDRLEQLIDTIAAELSLSKLPAPQPGQTVKWWWNDAAQKFVMTVINPEDLYLIND
jgi:hypothetical protein